MNGYIQKNDFDSRFKIFHDLMPHKVGNILLISRQYDAWVMEEDCRLSEKIVKQYRGLNLSHPPRLRWATNAQAALNLLENSPIDLVIIIAPEADADAEATAATVKGGCKDVPVILMVHRAGPPPARSACHADSFAIDHTFVWTGNTDVLFALIKNSEDRMNVAEDTRLAGIRVILFVEDSPEYTSAILPILYKELVLQVQAVMEGGLNEEHRLLAMRARPKILLAGTFEKAMSLYKDYKDHILGVISDVRYPRKGKLDGGAGYRFLDHVKSERFDIPLLMASAESQNRAHASQIPARFVDKNSPTLPSEVRKYFREDLGFGDFVFRMPDGREIGRAKNLKELETQMDRMPEEAFLLHCRRNDFSRWLFARSELELAADVRPIRDQDFTDAGSHCAHLRSIIHEARMQRQKGLVIDYDSMELDYEFGKIGSGSLGGKARGLAFMNTLLYQQSELHEKFPGVAIRIPQTVVITTEEFDTFIDMNGLYDLAEQHLADDKIAARFMAGKLPSQLTEQLRDYLLHIRYPLAVRSSSLLEDAQYRAYAGLYNTYMLANDHGDLECRLAQLTDAVKMVFASTYFSGPKAFSLRVGNRTEEEKMAVIVQELIGASYGSHYYPAISGVAQSLNYYPFADMKTEDGVATIALGLGKSVMGGESSLRFSPAHPEVLPDRSSVNDLLKNAQRYFYSVKLGETACQLGADDSATLKQREVYDACSEWPVRALSSTFDPQEGRIRDSFNLSGSPVVTFHSVLKHATFPLAGILADLLRIGEAGMGSPVEMEFGVNLGSGPDAVAELVVLQLRPMGAREEVTRVDISAVEIDNALICSHQALGNTVRMDMRDIVFVKPTAFDPGKTQAIAREIRQMNTRLTREGRKYVLIGPGRWGSADRWLGIPVRWEDISGVGAMVETEHPQLRAEPSQGSHFFHNITTLGINYLTVSEAEGDRIRWRWLKRQSVKMDTDHVALVRLNQPLVLKVDGRQGRAIVCAEDTENHEERKGK